jgi:Flp pilus assembly protein CpaB
VAIGVGTLVCFVIYKNMHTRSDASNEPVIDVVLASKLAAENPGFGHPSLIPSGMRAVSVRVDKVAAVADFVLPGTRVDVLLADKSRATTVSQNVPVIAVERKPHCNPVITLLVSPDDAEELMNAKRRIQLEPRNLIDLRRFIESRRTPRIIYPAMRAPLSNSTFLVYR